MYNLEIEPDDGWTYGCNLCVICNLPYKHRRVWIKHTEDDLPLLKEYISHPACEKLVNEIKKKRKELEVLEAELFEKQFCLHIYH